MSHSDQRSTALNYWMERDPTMLYWKEEINNTLYIPSVQAATEKGASVTFQANPPDSVYKDGKLYYLNTGDLKG